MRFKIITKAFRKFFDDDGTFLAGGLAFGLVFYSVPFILLTVSALSYTAVNSDTALAWIRRISLNLVPHSRELFDNFITDVIARRVLLGLFGFIAFLLARGTTFGSVRLVLNRVFGGHEQRGLVRSKFMEVVMSSARRWCFSSSSASCMRSIWCTAFSRTFRLRNMFISKSSLRAGSENKTSDCELFKKVRSGFQSTS